MRESAPVSILGAGLTGLSAALHLEVPSRIFEKASEPGGLARTAEERGYRFDRTGHLLHLRDPEMREWVLSILDRRPLAIRRRSRIWSAGVYTRYPFQSNTRGLPPEVARRCLLGFIEARDGERDRDDPPRDFEEFILRYMGSGIAEHFMIPYNTKLWGVPPREMSSAWTDRFVPRPTIEEVIDGALGVRRAEVGYNAEFFYPREGIGELPRAMARRIDRIELGSAPKAVDWKRRRLHVGGEEVRYERLISTVPLDVLLGLLDLGSPLPEEVTAAAASLRCAPLRYLDVALNRRPKRTYHWVYVPEPRYPFYRVGSYTNFSAALAPRGCGSFYVELASRAAPRLDRLVPRVVKGLVEMGLIDGSADVAFVKARYLPYAYVVYDHSYSRALEVIHPFLEEQGIVSRGRYGTWEYSAMEDALLAGRAAARIAQEGLS